MNKNISIQAIENGYLIVVSSYPENTGYDAPYPTGDYGTKQYFAESPQLVGAKVSDLLLMN